MKISINSIMKFSIVHNSLTVDNQRWLWVSACQTKMRSVLQAVTRHTRQYSHTYRYAGHSHRPRALSGHRSRICWDGNSAECGNPRHRHTHSSHPVTVVLAMGNCVDDLEVALQGDDHKTDVSRRSHQGPKRSQTYFSFKEPLLHIT